MSKAQKKAYKKEVADRLRKFGNVLRSDGIIGDRKPFEDAANQCEKGPIPEVKGVKIDLSNCWGYTLSNLTLSLPKKKKTDGGILPKGATAETVSISSTIIGNYTRGDYAEDPFSHLEFNVVIKGKSEDDSILMASWHLDRHLENKENKQPEDVHPIYHFQYGGKKLKLPDDNYGSHIVLETPRLMHLPLDAVLGVDFVLTNFLGSRRKHLCTKEKPYVDCVKDLQKILWRPYLLSVAQTWSAYPATQYDWDSRKICPQLL